MIKIKNSFENNYQNYIYHFKFKENALAENLKVSRGTPHNVKLLQPDSPVFASYHTATLELHGPPLDVK
jgi:hypothetical protein